MLWLCFKLPSCLFGNTRGTSVMQEKAQFVCFIYMQPQKVKFKSVQTSKFREFMSPAIIVYYLNEIMTKTSVKFQKNRHKTVGGVAHTRYPVSINFDSKNARKMPKLK